MLTILLSICATIPSILHLNETQVKNICKYESIIITEAKRNKIKPELLVSVIYVESAFYPRAVSSANACGLTQIIPKWTGGPETRYKKYTCGELKDPRTSIATGARILAYAIRIYGKGSVNQGLCYYNAGTACLKNTNLHKKLRYVKKVRKIYDKINSGN